MEQEAFQRGQREALDGVGDFVTAQVTRLVRLTEVGPGTPEACNIEAEFLQAIAERYRDAVRPWCS